MWEPILDGELAESAWSAVSDIADAVAADPSSANPEDVAVFCAYAAGAFDDPVSDERYDLATNALLESLETKRGFALFGGIANAGWVFAHIAEDAEEILEPVDTALLQLLSRPEPWTLDYDLIAGLTGLGVYFLERPDSPLRRDALRHLVGHFEKLAIARPPGIAWHTAPELLPAWQRERDPGGYYNCGLAHGIPGAIAMLARIAETPEAPLAARSLVKDAIAWVRAQQRPNERGQFPATVPVEGPALEGARTAWCYGDLGVAIALWAATERLGHPSTEWREVALGCAARPGALTGVRDAGFCHGAAGIAHICNRFYQASRDDRFRKAARRWFERTLQMRKPTGGVAGFFAVRPVLETPGVFAEEANAGLLEGAIGIGLSLLGALQDDEPRWDRYVLCDLPPAPASSTSST